MYKGFELLWQLEDGEIVHEWLQEMERTILYTGYQNCAVTAGCTRHTPVTPLSPWALDTCSQGSSQLGTVQMWHKHLQVVTYPKSIFSISFLAPTEQNPHCESHQVTFPEGGEPLCSWYEGFTLLSKCGITGTSQVSTSQVLFPLGKSVCFIKSKKT